MGVSLVKSLNGLDVAAAGRSSLSLPATWNIQVNYIPLAIHPPQLFDLV